MPKAERLTTTPPDALLRTAQTVSQGQHDIRQNTNKKDKKQSRLRRAIATATTSLALIAPSTGLGIVNNFGDKQDLKPLVAEQQAETINAHIFPLPKDYATNPHIPLNDVLRGTDGGASTTYNGVRLFTIADTFKSQKGLNGQEEWYMPRNGAVIVDEKAGTYTVLAGPKDAEGRDTNWLTPKENDGSFYWPLSPIVTKNGTELIIPLTRNMNDVQNPGWWKHVGMDLAKFKILPGNPYPVFQSFVELPRQEEKANKEIHWGSATLMMKDKKTGRNYANVYSTVVNKNDDPSKVTRHVQLARVENGDMSNLTKWEFWNGNSWTGVDNTVADRFKSHLTDDDLQALKRDAWKKAESSAAPLIMDPDMGNIYTSISTGFSVLNINGKIALVNKPGEFMNNQITITFADRPEGPFGKNKIIIDEVLPYGTDNSLKSEKGNVVAYAAYAYVDNNGQIQVSICNNLLPPDMPKALTPEEQQQWQEKQLKNNIEFVANGGYNFQHYSFSLEELLALSK